uniref:Secreted protein n=1 Tax=Amblyomma triste TaxID=251400 RepID=A0A023G0Q7_AMBTT
MKAQIRYIQMRRLSIVGVVLPFSLSQTHASPTVRPCVVNFFRACFGFFMHFSVCTEQCFCGFLALLFFSLSIL